jgi:hypothetical protein
VESFGVEWRVKSSLFVVLLFCNFRRVLLSLQAIGITYKMLDY